MIYKGHELMKPLGFVCKQESGEVNEFSVFANVVLTEGNSVHLERYLDFGRVPTVPAILRREDFEKYYSPVEADREITKSFSYALER